MQLFIKKSQQCVLVLKIRWRLETVLVLLTFLQIDLNISTSIDNRLFIACISVKSPFIDVILKWK